MRRSQTRLAMVLNLLISGAVVFVVVTSGIYRVVSRVFDWGPRDT